MASTQHKTQRQIEAQRRCDEIHSELAELYQQIREKERELDKYDRIANPQDYE